MNLAEPTPLPDPVPREPVPSEPPPPRLPFAVRQRNAYRLDAVCDDGSLLAWAVLGQYGWGIHARHGTRVETVARVDGPGKPWALRETAAARLHAVAARRLVGAS